MEVSYASRGVSPEVVARRLHAAGSGGLQREIGEGIREAARSVPTAMRARSLADLPRRGGFAAVVAASRVDVDADTGGAGGDAFGVTIRAAGSVDLDAVEAGQIRHPVFGRGPSVSQTVTAGVFSKALQDQEPAIRRGAEDAARRVADHIERG